MIRFLLIRNGVCTLALAGLLLVSSFNALAAESGARAYKNVPVGLNVLQLLYRHSERRDQIEVRSDIGVLRYFRAIDMFGKIGLIGAYVPFGKASLAIPALGFSKSSSGMADPTLVMGMDIYGAPTLSRSQFGSYKQDLIIGISLQVTLPVGEYDQNSTINLGANRWVFKPEIAVSQEMGDFDIEIYGNAHFFTDNDQYLGANVKSQKVRWGMDSHLTYNIMPGWRVSFDYFRRWSGSTRINGFARNDGAHDTTIGFTAHAALSQEHSLEFRYRHDTKTRSGNKFTKYLVQYQYLW